MFTRTVHERQFTTTAATRERLWQGLAELYKRLRGFTSTRLPMEQADETRMNGR